MFNWDRNAILSIPRKAAWAALLAFGLLIGAWHQEDAQASPAKISFLQRIVAAEEARATTQQDLEPILNGLGSSSVQIQIYSVRALGRLERPLLLPSILPLLSAGSPMVRAEAADAAAQALTVKPSAAQIATVFAALRTRFNIEKVPMVRAVLFESLGRLPYSEADDVHEAGELLSGVIVAGAHPTDEDRLGVALGLEELMSLQSSKGGSTPQVIEALRNQLHAPQISHLPRIRTLTLMALVAAGGADAEVLRFAQKDPDQEVRRIAAVGSGSKDGLARLELHMPSDPVKEEERPALIQAALADPSPMVRWDGLQAYSSYLQKVSCKPIIAAVSDPGVHVPMLALDLLAKPCPAPEKPEVVAVLEAKVATLPANPESGNGRLTWHPAAHAIVSLASVDPQAAEEAMPKFMANPRWQVRMYAARAAGPMSDFASLEKLAQDPDANVASTAIGVLAKAKGHPDDAVYIAALQRIDNRMGAAAGRALMGTKDPDATPALLKALAALTALRLDNTRDSRIAILRALKGAGGKDEAAQLQTYLQDFDPMVATTAAADITAWTGSPAQAAPVSPVPPPPDMAKVLKLKSSHIVITMANGGVMEMELYPEEAPATVDRIVTLVRKGYYNGLTFERWAPNWVDQGGSPGANELIGDSPFMNDEVGLRPHTRGALGISTRGHDTGDAQLFIDLFENDRLDHAYTVWGKVVKGMDVADTIVEGDVMRKLQVVPATDDAN